MQNESQDLNSMAKKVEEFAERNRKRLPKEEIDILEDVATELAHCAEISSSGSADEQPWLSERVRAVLLRLSEVITIELLQSIL